MKRRTFVKTVSAAGLGFAAPRSARRPGRSPNERVRVAVMGLNSRGAVLAQVFARDANAEVATLCDVDATVLAKTVTAVAGAQETTPKSVTDFRRALQDRDVDALVIAAPDHWHTPVAILALDAGKHVYLEKPGSHNARETELLVEAWRRSGRVMQFGTQQRSAPRSIEIVQAIREGAIGRPYLGRAWYANTRGSIGRGRTAPVPAHLDYDLWQGPAPRTPYRDNVIHYNWHWFRRWGTGEICNNGTHEIDVCRWALGVDRPVHVTSTGGRYHFDDDWEFTDTQVATFEYAEGVSIMWQGQSCNGLGAHGRVRGSQIVGTAGSVIVDREGYVVYDVAGKVVRDARATAEGDPLTTLHVADFVAAVRAGGVVRAPIDEGMKTALLGHLGNIAQWTGRALRLDAASGRIRDDARAMSHWQREYAPGWAPVV